ncbi:MAG: T9SS type A sorting domain-containing protein [Minisyncoccia bacterium]|jgi:hypothetical protein
MKYFRSFLVVAVALLIFVGVSTGQNVTPAYVVGFNPEIRLVVPGALISIPLFIKANGFVAMDVTIAIDPALQMRSGFLFDGWRFSNYPLFASNPNTVSHELKIAIAGSTDMDFPEFSRIGVFWVKVPEKTSTGVNFPIKISVATFNGVFSAELGRLNVTVGPQVLLGDADLDGKISAMDASFCLTTSLQPDSVRAAINSRQLLSGDVNGDGDINEIDADCIIQKDVNLTGYHFPIEDYPGGTGGEKGSIQVPVQPVMGGYAVSLNSSATSGRFDISLPPGVTLEPNGISRAMSAERYDEGTKTLSIAFAGDVPSGTLFTLRGANASNAKITGRLDGIEADIRKVEKVTDVESASPPKDFVLGQNYPNPFNPSTKISFTMPKTGSAVLKVFDMQGREIATLVNGEVSIGSHEVTFDASRLSSGTYIYRFSSGDFTETKRMILLK